MSKKKKQKTAPAHPPPQKKSKALWVILAAALVIRLLYLYFSLQSPFYEPLILDPAYYDEWAHEILKGALSPEGVFRGLPLYPFFLALVYKIFQDSLLAVKLIQAFLGLGTVFLVYKIGRRLFDEKTGTVAAALAAFYGPLFFHESVLIPEAIGVPLYALALYALVLFLEAPTAARGIFLGIACGLAALAKAGIIPFVFLFTLSFALRPPKLGFLPYWARIAALAGLASFVLTLAPVAAYNFTAGKDRVLLTSHGGFNFYIGNNPKAEGVFVAPEGTEGNIESQIRDSKAVAERELGRSLKPSEVSKYWSDKAWDYIRANPADSLTLYLKKLFLFFDAREISDVDDYRYSRIFVPFLKLPWPAFWLLGPLFFLGLAVSGGMKHRGWAWLWVACYVGSVAAFFVNARYRLPVLSVFFPFAAAGFLRLWESLRRGLWKDMLFCCLVLAPAIGLTQLRLVEKDVSRDHTNVGDIYTQKKEYEKATEFYKKALALNPSHSKALQGMGIALTKMGDYDAAKEYYLRAIDANPQSALAHNNLGLWYDRRGDLEEAKSYFLKALAIHPSYALAHNNLGMVYGKLGDYDRARREFETAIELDPAKPRFHTNLGLVLYRFGQKAAAAEHWRRALELDPAFEEARRALKLSQQQS